MNKSMQGSQIKSISMMILMSSWKSYNCGKEIQDIIFLTCFLLSKDVNPATKHKVTKTFIDHLDNS